MHTLPSQEDILCRCSRRELLTFLAVADKNATWAAVEVDELEGDKFHRTDARLTRLKALALHGFLFLLRRLPSTADQLPFEYLIHGYFPQPKKCVLIVKPEKETLATEFFKGTAIEITTIGNDIWVLPLAQFKKEVPRKLRKELPKSRFYSNLLPPNRTQLHFLQGRWTFVSRTVPEAEPLLSDLEKAIREDFVPALLGRNVRSERPLVPWRDGNFQPVFARPNCLRLLTCFVCPSDAHCPPPS